MANMFNFYDEVLKIKDELLKDTQDLLRIPSVLTEYDPASETPFGKDIHDAFLYMLDLGKKDGFQIKNIDNYAGHLEVGEGDEILGILCHLDVVPVGDNWKFPPFSATIDDGKLYARGAIDDKGPTMAAYYAVKLLMKLGVKFNKKIRIILGLDEESGWRCVERYFEKEAMPDLGFAPDANFPLIYGEKGILSSHFTGKVETNGLHQLHFGERDNVVPDHAYALVDATDGLEERFNQYLNDNLYKGKFEVLDSNQVKLHTFGKNAHAMEPEDGLNAGFILCEFLNTVIENDFIRFMVNHITFDSRAKKLGLALNTDIMGELTVNAGVCRYANGEFKLTLNFRYPIGFEVSFMKEKMVELAKTLQFNHLIERDQVPHFVDPESDFIQTLHQAYIKYTNDTETPLLTIGGGTYARSLKKAVAFGPMMPGREDVVHQPNEYMVIEDLLKATAIYAEAIYNLTR
jgi:succinyl-diaminopimelate desuccinylase